MSNVGDRVLRALSDDGPMTFAQIAARTGDHEPSVRRTVQGLVANGWVAFDRYADRSATDKVWRAL